jgi:hypothetical protein
MDAQTMRQTGLAAVECLNDPQRRAETPVILEILEIPRITVLRFGVTGCAQRWSVTDVRALLTQVAAGVVAA